MLRSFVVACPPQPIMSTSTLPDDTHRNTATRWDRVWIGASLATMDAAHLNLGRIEDGVIAIRDGRIACLDRAHAAEARIAREIAP